MSYLVLARKYRPRNFREMVGQPHVVTALGNALVQKRLHHAYLFTGTRGVGKTTVSRILAKSLNCVGPDGRGDITAEPCGVCEVCRAIDAGNFVDYTELDAASNRGVDEVQQLLEQAVYKPVQGRFKVFMIDEVHMLTNTAFNAMLKTLEEPPEYLKFVLATTDPQKVPVTVLSRCLQFNLRPMAPETVRDHLETVLQAESVPAEGGALTLLSRAARGSMRDALSLTDQAIAFGSGQVLEDNVRQMLGAVDRQQVLGLIAALAQGDGRAVLALIDQARASGLSASGLLEDMAQVLQHMAVLQVAASPVPADADAELQHVHALAQAMPRDETQLLYSICIHGKAELGLAPDEYAGLTMVLLRLLAYKLPEAEKKTPEFAAPALSAPTVGTVAAHQSMPPLAPAVASPSMAAPVALAPAALATESFAAASHVPVRAPVQPLPESASLAVPAAPAAPMAAVAVNAPSMKPVAAPVDVLAVAPVQAVSPEVMAVAPAQAVAPVAPATPPMPAISATSASRTMQAASAAALPLPAIESGVQTEPPEAEKAWANPPAHDDGWGEPIWDEWHGEPDAQVGAPVVPAATRQATPPWEQVANEGHSAPAVQAVVPSHASSLAPASMAAHGHATTLSVAGDNRVNAHPTAGDGSVSSTTASAALPPLVRTELGDVWHEIVGHMVAQELLAAFARELALQSQLMARDGAVWQLTCESGLLGSAGNVERVKGALATLGHAVELQVTQGPTHDTPALRNQHAQAFRLHAARQLLEEDPFVRALKRDFGATIIDHSVQPL